MNPTLSATYTSSVTTPGAYLFERTLMGKPDSLTAPGVQSIGVRGLEHYVMQLRRVAVAVGGASVRAPQAGWLLSPTIRLRAAQLRWKGCS